METREMFTILRYEYYATARYIAFTCGSFSRISHYLLGMAVELSYKQICYELRQGGTEFSKNEIKIIETSHSLKSLHELCKSKGRLQDITNYESFLFYADAFYKTRYPSQVKESIETAHTKFNTLSFSAHNVFPYDDLISQIDLDIFDLTKEMNKTIIYTAIDHQNSHLSNSVFHSNGVFYNLIPKFIKLLNKENEGHLESITFFEERKETILMSKEVYLSTPIETSLHFNMPNFIKHLGEK